MAVSKSVLCGTVIVALVSCFLPEPVEGADEAWQPRGTGGGGALFSPAISPHDNRLLYMATDMSSVFRSNSFGAQWKALPFTKLRGGGNTQVCFTSDPNILYATHRGEGGTRLPVSSTDGGKTFLPLPTDPTGGRAYMIHADPKSTQRLLVCIRNQMFYSSDAGASFSSVFDASSNPGGLHLAGVFWDGKTIYAGTNLGLIVSKDAGANFASDTTKGIPDSEGFVSFAGAKNDGQTRFLGVTYDRNNLEADMAGSQVNDKSNHPKVYRLNLGETSWSLVRDDIDSNRSFFVSMSLQNTNVAYLAGSDSSSGKPMVLKTTDGGTSWQSVFLAPGNQNIATGWVGAGGDLRWSWPELAMGFSVASNNPDCAVMTDFGFVHVTDDGGKTWRQAYVDPATQNPAGNDTPKGRAYKSAGADQTSVWSLRWTSADTIIASFTDICGTRSTDGGQTWTAGSALGLPHNTTYHIVAHPVDGSLYAATSSVHDLYQSTYLQDSRIDGGEGYIMRSADEGASWKLLHDFNHPVVWLANHADKPETLYASVVHSTEGGIYVTHNLSTDATFTPLNKPARTEGHPYNLHVLDDGSLLASWSGRRDPKGKFTQSSGVFLSTDGGTTWLDRSNPNMRRWTKDIVIDPHDTDQNTWYAAVFSHWGAPPNNVGGVFRTTNRGLTWKELGEFDWADSITVDPLNHNIAYVTTELQGLWKTNNLAAVKPTFVLDRTYPFQHPVRILFNPFKPGEKWSTSFGAGLHVSLPASEKVDLTSNQALQIFFRGLGFSDNQYYNRPMADKWTSYRKDDDFEDAVCFATGCREQYLAHPDHSHSSLSDRGVFRSGLKSFCETLCGSTVEPRLSRTFSYSWRNR